MPTAVPIPVGLAPNQSKISIMRSISSVLSLGEAAISVLAKLNAAEAPVATLNALATLDTMPNADNEQDRARTDFTRSEKLESFVSTYNDVANGQNPNDDFWADVALLSIAAKPNASPESAETAKQAGRGED